MSGMNDEPDFYINSDEPGKPKQTEHSEHHEHMVAPESSRKEYLKFGGIILFLLFAGFGMSTLSGFHWEEWMRWFMGGFFIIFGSFKLIGLENFVVVFRDYDILAKKFRPYPYIYPFIEILLGMFYVLNMASIVRDIFTIALMLVGAYGVYQALQRRDHIKCACLGNIIKLPLTTVSLIENLTMAAMALIMLLTTLFT